MGEIEYEVPKHELEYEVSERGFVVAKERLALTEDGARLVLEEDPEARWLYAIPGQEIPMAAAEKFGLLAKPKQAEEPKQAEPAADKKADKPADKQSVRRRAKSK